MNIVVCIKQVPSSSNVKVDPVTGNLIRDGVNSKMNPYDLYALELALKIKEHSNSKITVISMGPPNALEVIKEAIYMGADEGILLSDRKFGGADVLATSYTIAEGIKTLENYDLILTGKQTTDGDTGQIGPELAEHLHIPHASNVTNIELIDDKLAYVSNLDFSIETAYIKLPCVLSTDTDINTPRLPSFKRKMEYKDCKELIKIISFNDLKNKDENLYGQKGSATQVERIFEPEKRKDKEIYDGDKKASKILEILKDKRFI